MEQSLEMPCAISRLRVMGKIKMHTQGSPLYRKQLVTLTQISFSCVCSHFTQLCYTNLRSNDDTPHVDSINAVSWFRIASAFYTVHMCLCFKHTTSKCGSHTNITLCRKIQGTCENLLLLTVSVGKPAFNENWVISLLCGGENKKLQMSVKCRYAT